MSDNYSYKIVVKVKDIKDIATIDGHKGVCNIHEIGDEYEMIGPKLILGPKLAKKGICFAALKAISGFIDGMKYGANPAFLKGKDVYEACCPDPRNLVIFEIKRIKIK